MEKLGYLLASLVSAALLVGSYTHRVPLDPTEVLGFVTGALCVWLTVKQNIWNWPIGIANCIFFVVLFARSRLYADMSLQVVYIVLGILGWYWWLFGGERRTVLTVSRTPTAAAAALALFVVAGTWGMTLFLRHIHDSAPFLDAFTTLLSLAAQTMLTKKWIENWHVWIAADVIYVGLYAYKHLPLTAVLYALFIGLCLRGLADWRRSARSAAPQRREAAVHG